MTRSEAIGHLKNIVIYSVQDGYTDEARQALDMAIKALEEQSRWIPCSERLPKHPYRVQIQLYNGWIITGYYTSEKRWYTVPHCGDFFRKDEVEAWRELPKPYGGKSND